MIVSFGHVCSGSSEDVRSEIIAFKHNVVIDIGATGNFSSVEFSISSLNLDNINKWINKITWWTGGINLALPLPQLKQSYGTFEVVAKALAWSLVIIAIIALTVFLSFLAVSTSFFIYSSKSARAFNLESIVLRFVLVLSASALEFITLNKLLTFNSFLNRMNLYS